MRTFVTVIWLIVSKNNFGSVGCDWSSSALGLKMCRIGYVGSICVAAVMTRSGSYGTVSSRISRLYCGSRLFLFSNGWHLSGLVRWSLDLAAEDSCCPICEGVALILLACFLFFLCCSWFILLLTQMASNRFPVCRDDLSDRGQVQRQGDEGDNNNIRARIRRHTS